MKKYIKTITAFLLTAVLAAAGVTAASADGYILYAGYTFSLDNRLAVIHSYEGGTELYIPQSIWGYTVVGIEDSAFFGRDDFNSLVIKDSKKLTSIGSNAFYGCSGFTRVELPSKVETLGSCAFQYCTGIRSADLSATLIESIERQTFYGCTSLESVALPAGLQSIGEWAFGNCTSLEYVEIPQSVSVIENSAFSGDSSLTLGVWYDSYAYNYAKANGISYRLLDGVMLGDVNKDGIVNISDVTAIQRYLSEIEPLDELSLLAVDVNQDGNIDILDASTLQMFLAEYVIPYPIGESPAA